MRGTSGLLALALCLLLTACGAAEEPPETADPPAGLMEAVCRSQEGLPERLVIVTDGYHQLRGRIYAGTQGFTQVYSWSGKTPWGLLPSYGVREMLAIGQAVVLKGGRIW